MKSGSLKLLKPSGPVQACNEIALTFTISHAVANRFERDHESVVRQGIYLSLFNEFGTK